ncbi:MAG TPA: hypothetical protein VGR07_13355 [Thermoanaerobaculia bacterium]|nr:hypothetical protein [Thermoanaerobaculia bacterium]
MQVKKIIATLTFVVLLIGALTATAATSSGTKILNVVVKVTTASGGTVGTFSLKPSQVVPTKAGGTYTLTLFGTTISGGKTVLLPLNATFAIQAGKGRILLSSPGSNSVVVKVLHRGQNGNLVKYTATGGQGYDIRKGLAKGYISLF